MTVQDNINYRRIAAAIAYIKANFKSRPSLEAIAAHVNVSPFHFQRLFTEWAGTSPKNFLQYTGIEYAKYLLKEQRVTLFDAAYETGLSGTGRLHDLFIKIEGMTPAEYKNGGANLSINYSMAPSPFGNVVVASTGKGVCYMAFFEEEVEAIALLQNHFPNAVFRNTPDSIQQNALLIFQKEGSEMQEVKLHLKGSAFQLKVWDALLKIPMGGLSTYGNIAGHIQNLKASRAVGTAIGSNPVAFLIPCHRVIKSTGEHGEYMWSSNRKTAIIGWEAAHVLGIQK